MDAPFEFATATRIVFGVGVFQQAGRLASELGRRALLVCGQSPDAARPLEALLEAAGVSTVLFLAGGEPSLELIEQGIDLARREACDLVIGFGGGSAIDTGKALAALLANPGPVLDYLEVVGRGRPLQADPRPYIAIPTTAGTGAEVTRNAVIGVPSERVKVSLRSPRMLPRLALVDPQLTVTLPPAVTAATGMDALTQLIEPYVCAVPNPLVDALCKEGLPRIARSLRRACQDGADLAARQDMSLAALFGGLALANARLGAVHGFAGVLGGMYPAPHGAICARLLPGVTAANLDALQQRAPDHPALRRYGELAELLTDAPPDQPGRLVDWLSGLVEDLHIPRLARYGVQPGDFAEIVEKSARASSMQGNPLRLSPEELTAILAGAL
ncbi:MAG: iron-containing alcohol dehydrogenase [Chloroflexota bacterium]